MPVIAVNSLELLEEQKKRIAQKFTKILSEETNVPEERIYVFFTGYGIEDIAAGGILNSELPEEVLKQFNTKYSQHLRDIEKKQ